MDEHDLDLLLTSVAEGRTSVPEALVRLKGLGVSDLGFARIDRHREIRTGFAEAIYCPGKTPEQVAAIAADLAVSSSGGVIATRATPEQYEAVSSVLPAARFDPVGKVITVRTADSGPEGLVLVVSAGTADQVPAAECLATLEAMAVKSEQLQDVGVAGIHRLLAELPTLERADLIVVVAGMEGALASVVGGLVDVPVIAVPTSAGYGAGVGGITPLLAMLNSCAPGVSVVNIDNGYGAAVFAATVLRSRT